MEKMKVVLFEILPTIEKMLTELLKSISFVELIEHNVNNTEDALSFITARQPDVVILGNDFPGIDLFSFTEIIRKEAATTQVIMIDEVVSAESVRLAMRAGACDFICYKNITAKELSAALEHAGNLADEERVQVTPTEKNESAPQQQGKASPDKRTKIITVYSPKGGAGVSTIVANLAWALSSNRLKILVVDCNFLYGDMGVLFNQQSNHSIIDFARFKGNIDDEVIQEVINHGDVDLLAAPSNIEKSIEITGQIFEKILKQLSQLDYDYILINTNSHLTDPVIVALEEAETIIIVGTQEISSVRAIGLFLDIIGTLSIPINKLVLVINRFDNNSSLTMGKLTGYIKINTSYTIPQDYGTVLLANNLGIPFVKDHQELPISLAIGSLAHFLIKGKGQKKSTPLSTALKTIKNTFSTEKH